MMQEEFEGIVISFSVWMKKQVALQGGEMLCEVSEVKNVDAVTRVSAERGLSTLSTTSRYCKVGAAKIGLSWIDGRYFPNIKLVLLESKWEFLTTTGCESRSGKLSSALALAKNA